MKTSGLIALAVLAAVGACGGDEEKPFTDVTLDTKTNCGPPAQTSCTAVKGVQFETPVFEIPQGEEVQDCYFFTMPDLNGGQPYFVDHVRIGSNPGSHHANVFRVKTILKLGTEADGDFVHNGECFKSGNWADWPLVANNQKSNAGSGYFDWKLPPNVAYKFTPGERIMVQTHFVNASTQVTPFKGKVVLDLYKSALTAPMEMGTLFATQQSIRICKSNPNVQYGRGCAFKNHDVTVAAANGHFHSRGTRFEIFKWDGVSTGDPDPADRFYESLTWDDPPMTIYDSASAVSIPMDGGVRWTCDYTWAEPALGCAGVDARDPQMAGDCCYTFGPVVENSEHCNAFVYYYPKTDDITCF
jgi:hypothetical protein